MNTLNPMTQEQVRAMAQEAYLYGYPMVAMYKTLHAQALDPQGPNFKAPFNQIGHTAHVFTPRDTAFITPNSDTPYSFLWMDLRAEPLVLTLPAIEAERYGSVQLIDLCTHNVAYLGTRTTGNGGGRHLVAGPDWAGTVPEGIDSVVRMETQLAYAMYRTQLFDEADLPQVRAVQAGYRVCTLSAFLDQAPPAAPAPVAWPVPPADVCDTPDMFRYLGFLLQFAPTHPSELELRQRFTQIGINADALTNEPAWAPETLAALQQGIVDARASYRDFARTELAACRMPSAALFGSREHLRKRYIHRYAGALLGIFGNTAEEAVYLGYYTDDQGHALDASSQNYQLRFAPGELPPADAFWSLTLYDGQTKLLVDNPLQRYLINSRMLQTLVRDEDGGITLHVQHERPTGDAAANWLPAPAGPFNGVLRLYLPRADVLQGPWTQPPLVRVDKTSGNALRTAARDAFLFALPLVEIANVRARFLGAGIPAGTFFLQQGLATPEDRHVTTPNVDTVYANTFIDLSQGPARLTLPAFGDRYASLALMDMYSNNMAVLGSRTTGQNGGTFTLVGPNDPAPTGAIRSPTPWVWAMARVVTHGPDDVPDALAVLRGFQCEAAPASPRCAGASRAGNWQDWMTAASRLLIENPPPATDRLALQGMAPLGLGSDVFDPRRFSSAERQEMAAGVEDAKALAQSTGFGGKRIGDWVYPASNTGHFFQDYLTRARVAISGLAALPPAEAMYLTAVAPDGQLSFNGPGPWRLSFAAGALPPVNAFWSLTMYQLEDSGSLFLAPNAIGRHSIGDRTPGLAIQADGRLDLWVSREDPGASRKSNWLPAPKAGPFSVVLRTYLPREALLRTAYTPPSLGG